MSGEVESIVYFRNKENKWKYWGRNKFYAKFEEHEKNEAPSEWSYVVAQRKSWNGTSTRQPITLVSFLKTGFPGSGL